jgi:plasmid segregation protein ParM
MAKAAGNPDHLVIQNLVLGLPLNTYFSHQEALRLRAHGDHILSSASGSHPNRRVTVENVIVLVQPQGTLVNFSTANFKQQADKRKDGWMLVVDPGGGTLDWFLTRGNQPNWERSGAYPKAMLACSVAVCDQINVDWKNEFDIVESVDEAIREQAETFTVGAREYKLADYWQSVECLLDESIQFMLASVGSTANLAKILLTGGGARVYHNHLNSHYPELAAIVHMDDAPVFSNVRGFQVVGEMNMTQQRKAA